MGKRSRNWLRKENWLDKLRDWQIFQLPSVHDSAVYTVGNYWMTAMQSGANLLARSVVEVAAFGANSFGQAVYSYIDRYNSVLRLAVDREVPRLRGKGDDQKAEDVIAGAYTAVSASVLVESLVLASVAVVVGSPYMKAAFGALSLVNVFGSIANLDQVVLKATKRFNELAVVNIGAGTLGAAVIAGGAFNFGFMGFFGGIVTLSLLQYVGSRIFLLGATDVRPRYTYEARVLKEVYKVGLPIMIFGVLQTSIFAVDRFFVEGFIGLDALGFYSLAAMGLGIARVLPRSLIGAYFPTFMSQLGSGQHNIARSRAESIQGLVGTAAAIILGTGIVVIDPAVRIFLPEYEPASFALKALLVAAYVYTGCIIPYYVHLGVRRMRPAILCALGGVTSAIGLNLALVQFGINGVAVATVSALTVYVGLISLSAEALLEVRGLFRQVAPGAGLILCVLAVELYVATWLAGGLLAVAAAGFVWFQKELFALR